MKTKPIFRVNVDKDEIWRIYLNSFPPGTNPIFRERTEHDCSACKQFIRNAGGMVNIEHGEVTTLWDIDAGSFQPIVDALTAYVRNRPIENLFLSSEPRVGVDKNFEESEAGVLTWEHLHLTLPSTLVASKVDIGPRLSNYQADHDVMLRSLQGISRDAIETVQDLISQNSLYRGAEKKAIVDAFAELKRDFDNITVSNINSNVVGNGLKSQDLFAWSQVIGPNAFVCRIRNDVIGTLLVDLSEGVELEKAVKSFEDKVSGTNYKRPTALITPRMRDNAKAALTELGLMDSLERRYARLEDIDIKDVLFADRNAKKRMAGDVFDALPTKGQSSKNFDRVEEVSIEKFICDILPTATSLELLMENRHVGNLVSLIAPADLTAKHLFKWDNPFSWSYNGDVADSIKEKVKAAGGNVTGDICCRLAWFNADDLDLHMTGPNMHIYYGAKQHRESRLVVGELDVDMNVHAETRTPVENIFFPDKSKVRPGTYTLSVEQFTKREMVDTGFEVEIDVLGEVHQFAYNQSIPSKKTIEVARLEVDGHYNVKVIPILPSSQATREVWSLKTQEFHPVTAMMLSPNFWGKRGVEDATANTISGIGNKHYIFTLDGCRNDGSARGFYNEFLHSGLEPHRKTMEIVGSRMRTDENDENQLSGVGFSSTQKNSVVIRVGGSFNRVVKVVF